MVNALPGSMGFEIFKAVSSAGRNIVDITFFQEDPFAVDHIAKKRGVTAIMDCGVAPGMSNLLIGHVAQELEDLHSVRIYVGGLPMVREWPYEYKAVFSPMDVIEEYIRPARFMEAGKMIVKQALTDRELLNFPEIGTLEAFNTDGLRTLLKTIKCPEMTEKTLRYPGHVDKILLLRDIGFFRQDTIEVGGLPVRPIDVTASLLFPKWELKEGEQDFTIMRILAEGSKGEKKYRYQYELLDRFDPDNGITSMARTTGYTATMAVRLLAAGLFQEQGVIPLEFIGRKSSCVKFMLQGLEERGIIYRQKIQEI